MGNIVKPKAGQAQGAIAKAKAKAEAVAKTQSENQMEPKAGTVLSVTRDVDGNPVLKAKSNGSVFMTCRVTLDELHPKTGQPITILAFRTVSSIDDNGEVVEKSEVTEGQAVQVYARIVEDENGKKTIFADIATGSTDNNDEDLINAWS